MRVTVLILVLLAIAIPLVAQTDAQIAANLILNENQLKLNLADPSLTSPVLTPLFALQFEGSGDSRSASALGGWFICGDLTPDKCLASDPLGLHGKLSAPVSAKAKSATLVNLHGFDGKTSLEIAFKWSNAATKINEAITNAALDSALTSALAARLDASPALRARLQASGGNDDESFRKTIAALRAAGNSSEIASSAMTLSTALASLAAVGPSAARSETIDLIARSIRTTDLPPASPFRGRWATPYYTSLVFTTARPAFEYADSSYADKKEKHPVYAASFFVGVTPLVGLTRDSRYYLGLSQTYKVDYKEGDSSNICTPIESTTTLHCRDVAIGAPARQRKPISEIEYRRFFRHVGFNPKANYDWKSHALGLEVPMYLRQDATGNFGGGIKAAWDTKKREFNAIVFISAFPGVKLP
jgi:hypothetical protein